MKDCGSRLFRQKLKLMDYNFKILYRPGALNHVADALSRIEPLSISEIMEIENKNDASVPINSQKAMNNSNININIEEKNGTILKKYNFDLIFHLVPKENDTLKNKLTNELGVINFFEKLTKINKNQFAILISNQFANIHNTDNTLYCLEEIKQMCAAHSAKNIAINIDFDNIRHYLYFKQTLQDIFSTTKMNVTLFLNKIVELKEREDIEKY